MDSNMPLIWQLCFSSTFDKWNFALCNARVVMCINAFIQCNSKICKTDFPFLMCTNAFNKCDFKNCFNGTETLLREGSVWNNSSSVYRNLTNNSCGEKIVCSKQPSEKTIYPIQGKRRGDPCAVSNSYQRDFWESKSVSGLIID